MNILQNLLGSLTSGIIRLGIAVGILAAVYFFVLKPVLDTTSESFREANRTFEKTLGPNGAGYEDISGALDGLAHGIKSEVKHSFHFAEDNGNPRRLVHCIRHANGDVHKIQRCTVKF